MLQNIINRVVNDKRAEINMIAIVLILIVVILLAVIFKDSMSELLKNIFQRINQDVQNF